MSKNRKYLNIKDLKEKEFELLQQIGFKSIAGGVVSFNKTKVELSQLESVKRNIELLSSWVFINNSQKIHMNGRNKYQVLIWIKLIKRENKVSLKELIGIFTALKNIQNNKEYRNKYSKLFCERLSNIQNLSEDWKDRIIRTVTGL